MAPQNSLISVQWTDSGMHINHNWASLDEFKKNIGPDTTVVQTVGMLMHEEDEYILVGQSYDPTHDTWYGAQMILKSNVVSVNNLAMQPE